MDQSVATRSIDRVRRYLDDLVEVADTLPHERRSQVRCILVERHAVLASCRADVALLIAEESHRIDDDGAGCLRGGREPSRRLVMAASKHRQ